MGRRKHASDGIIKVGRIHSPQPGVTRWRCRLSSKFFDYLLLLLLSRIAAIGATYSYRRRSLVCVSVGHFVSSAKKAKPIKLPFGWVTRVDPRNYVLNGVQSPQGEWEILRVVRPIKKHCEPLLCHKMLSSNCLCPNAFLYYITALNVAQSLKVSSAR